MKKLLSICLILLVAAALVKVLLPQEPTAREKAVAALQEKDIAEDDYDTALQRAVQEKQGRLIRDLLLAGADPNARSPQGNPLIVEVTHQNSMTLVQRFLDAGADINAKGQEDITPLHRAMWDRHYKMSQMLIKAGASTEGIDVSKLPAW